MLTADHTPVAFHILHDYNDVVIVDVGGSCRCLFTDGRVNKGEFIELCLARHLALWVACEL